MNLNRISVMIGGEAGAGITRSGLLFAKACMRAGLHVFGTNDYQSLIRGGHNYYIVRVDAEDVYSQADDIDLLVALNQESILLHRGELAPGGGIIYDGEEVELSEDEMGIDNVGLYSVPLRSMVKELEAEMIMRNTIALGAAAGLLDFDLKILNGVIKDTFREDVAKMNVEAAKVGYDYACNYSRNQYIGDFEYRLKKIDAPEDKRLLIAGNEAVGLGAIQAGCKFYAAYPMTPATPILHFMAEHEREYGMITIPAESEISAMNMVAGASYAGARAMTATSGGGFCLMTEALGMAGMTETPVVVVLAQRTGPSTGLPTYTSQGDLRFAIHASQGEFPRVVIAPGDIEECFYKTMEAFNLAEKYQIPAIVLTDKYLAESHSSVESFETSRISIDRGALSTADEYGKKEAYQRHKLTEDGISPRVMPGTKGSIVRTNADEHDENGYTTEDPKLTVGMADKRFKKLEVLIKDLEDYETTKIHGPQEADVTILGWGSTKGPIREAMKLLNKETPKSNYLQILYLCPFPVAKIQKNLESAKLTVVVENNNTSQLSSLLREHLLKDVNHKILKYDGRPFNPKDLSQRIQEVL